jgi:hypothetical protein
MRAKNRNAFTEKLRGQSAVLQDAARGEIDPAQR